MNDFQKKVKLFCDRNNLNSPVEFRILDAIAEFGEVAKEILKMTNYGKNKLAFRQEISGELGDTFYSLITVANYFNVDLLEALELVIKKYEKRLLKGSPGSEND